MRRLEQRTIVLGLSGGIAGYKAAETVRLLVKAGAGVRVVMTRNAQQFITPLTLQTLSGHPVATDTFDLTQESEIGHIKLADSADVVVVAPATANVIGKLAHGIADDLLTTLLLAVRAPVLIAPAMNNHMYENTIVQENLARLRAHGYRIIEPAAGYLACGYEGQGRLADPEVIVAEVARALTPPELSGQCVLVSAGPNREPIDPVRFISNRSTGKMGFALAAAAWRRGAEVVLVAGPTSLTTPHGVRRVDVSTAAEMQRAVLDAFERANVVLMSAAVADYRPVKVAPAKLKKGAGNLQLELARTADILSDLGPRKGDRIVVGFAAETEAVLANAQRKLREKGVDFMVANDVSRVDAGFAVDTNAVTIVGSDNSEELPLMSKDEVAEAILDRVVARLRARQSAILTPSSRAQCCSRAMGEPRSPEAVQLVAGLLAATPALLAEARAALSAEFGPLEAASAPYRWSESSYYSEEMGAEIWRQFVSFAACVDAGDLAAVKQRTNAMEGRWRSPQGRRVNLDPGYLADNKLVLASTKDAAHRIYLGGGIYAEATLHFAHGSWRPYPYTYRDYAGDTAVAFFNAVRARRRAAGHGAGPEQPAAPATSQDAGPKR
ncbi:MAG: bifunctional phosphopantothenoylcysteine decarboxylase/phosphopantothenate--cysteine ligase CoaBC [Deltaproteobacteria bacterium]|nr:bifunctional phosphopantothenoylcysteine decarboxylase/phosphopantothenate--cysteine ligase CoaBC [Deltaproteobacteria bacterium]